MASQVLGDRFASRYEVQQQLGKRAGRRTLLARDIVTQELVVVKLVSFGSDFEWDDLKLFEREAQTLKSLSHPAIPQYLDYFELDSPTGKKLALVQTYVEGKSLEEQLKAGRTFSETEVKQIAKALLEILIYLHGRQPPVIHRDIKPSNILLHNRSGNSVGEVYLVDFGSVQTLAGKEGGTITVVGTYGYMPQEQFGGRTVGASDLYSLGATLIYLVTGTHPADLPQKDFRIQFEQACNLTPALSSWLRWMTEPVLDRRLASAAQALQALEQEQPTRDSVPLAIDQPANSEVSLTKNADCLEILLPPWGFDWHVGLASFMSVVFLAPLFIPLQVGDFASFIALLFTLSWMGIPFLGIVLSALGGQIRLRIDRQQISSTYQLFGFEFKYPRPSSSQAISKLECTSQRPKSWFNRRPKLIIWAKGRKYELNGRIPGWGKLLTEPEIDWLAHEISEWLGMPISKEELPPPESSSSGELQENKYPPQNLTG
jgi:serine/threonine protein kinase